MVQIKKNRGFSLVEISIVLLVVAVAVSSGVMVFNKYSNESKVSQTQFTMKQVMKALKQYVQFYGELPCPADITLPDTDRNFGFGIDPGACTDTISSGDMVVGMVPVSSLNIYPSLANDAWGNRFTYIVMKASTADDSICTPLAAQCPTSGNYSNTYITLLNEQDQTYSSNILVVLLSHGANGYGAYSGRGGAAGKSTAPAGADEITNADYSALSAFPPYAGFDDIVEIWTYEQLLDPDTME